MSHSYVIRTFLEPDADPRETRLSFLNMHGVRVVTYNLSRPHVCEVSYNGPSREFDRAINNCVGVEETLRVNPAMTTPTV